MFWKKKADKQKDNKTILGMVMLDDNNSFDVGHFVHDFRSNYVDSISELNGDSTSLVCTIGKATVAIAYMPFPIPSADIKAAANYAYNWQSAFVDTEAHRSHLIVSLSHDGQDHVTLFKAFTRALSSLLRTTNSIGVYKGSQSLLIPKEDYLQEAGAMSEEYLPLNLWIYFGLRVTDNGNSGYTYGLKEFNKAEMEIVNSAKSLEDIRAFLFNIAHYVLDHDVVFQNGQTIGGSEDEKVAIRFSKGRFVEGDTVWLAY